VFEHFRQLARHRITILISHRFSTVRMADEIAVLDHGRIIERGSHEELMQLNGRYAHLFTLQARGYR
jgi:ABC-type multidrug transport system fused ATPase/permease subunit